MSSIRIFACPLPTTPELSVKEVRNRLNHYRDRLILARACDPRVPLAGAIELKGSEDPDTLHIMFDGFSLRQIARIVDRIEVVATAPRMN